MPLRWTIFRKGLLLLALPIAAQAIFLALLFVMRADQNEAEKWAIHSSAAIAKTETMLRLLQAAEARMMTFVATGDSRMLEAYQRAHDKFLVEAADLRERVRDNQSQQQTLDQISAEAGKLFDTWEAMATNASLVNYGPKGVQKKVDQAIAQFESVRERTRDFLAAEQQLSQSRHEDLARVRQIQFWLLVGGAMLTAIGAVLLAQFFRRAIGDRVRLLMDNTRRLATGQQLAKPLRGEDEISQLDRVFHHLADVLAQRNRENAMFVYSVSHDLRLPLVNLQGFGQELVNISDHLRTLLSSGPIPPGTRQAAIALIDRDLGEAIHFTQTGVARVTSIIDAMLRVSRAGRVEYHWQRVDLQAAVQRVVESLWDTITKGSIKLTVGTLPPIIGDPAAIEQLFANLIGNAVKYLSPDRGRKIEIGCLTGGEVVSAHAAMAESTQVYFVKDNGLGIPEEYLKKIFTGFRRLHPAVADGEGIGLALVKRVVERHGGQIWVESIVGEGSTFFVALPQCRPETSPLIDAVNQTPDLEFSDLAHRALSAS
jgi:signal transduction histidine kinase